MVQPRPLAPKALKLLERFRRQRAAADRSLHELDATACELTRLLATDGFTLREAAPLLSRDDQPITHAQIAKMRDGERSRRPWAGNRRKGA